MLGSVINLQITYYQYCFLNVHCKLEEGYSKTTCSLSGDLLIILCYPELKNYYKLASLLLLCFCKTV